MRAAKIDGRAIAEGLKSRVAAAVSELQRKHGVQPGLAVVQVGEDPASEVYVRSKVRGTIEAGMASFQHKLPAATSEADLLSLIAKLNANSAVHGILVQLPLPSHMKASSVIRAISPEKDVDGFHISNVGLLSTGQKAIVPCTPLGCLILLRETLESLVGLEAVVVGHSNIVGKPMAQLLLAENCTVTVAHKETRHLPEVCRRADVLVIAVGRPALIQGDWIKPGATVIDVGINRITSGGKHRLVGDVDFEGASKVARAITPVPGGVGPMTIACLLANTVSACCDNVGLARPDGISF
jgi:methylenetetrahydrofolate dehydrogenase (NADP+) / methenyltetrahydrofolate cyclohydrolase